MKNDLPDIVRGHEIWLEYEPQHLGAGDTFDCKLMFGHNLKKDGVAEAKKVKAVAFTDGNDVAPLEIETAEDGLNIHLVPRAPGSQTIAAEYDFGIITFTDEGWHRGPKKNYSNVKRSGYYYQYAKTVIQDSLIPSKNQTIGQELEISSDRQGHCHVGDTVTLHLLYDGKPLSEGQMTVATDSNGGQEFEVAIAPDGTVEFTIDQPGNWMFKVRHADPAKGVEDQFDEKVITSVLTIMDVH